MFLTMECTRFYETFIVAVLLTNEWIHWILNKEVAEEDISNFNKKLKNKWEPLTVEWLKI